ncbi:MAG: acyl-CoA transferase [Rhodospirillales bacterium RIFCSPLOWO2_12_FULL_58_28]|nr:MAG: acyl-CoA transferase [Rhodospirillales bacterium RIFCSPLOWO2_02_FULL_58_16]OHC78783.1 MAG: acyl-CoA transferase [Rhodospirillales bacterium RIFCSPLOWO2_12_FULL_58_28]
MPTRREQILAALLARLQTIQSAAVKREEPLPEKVPAAGLVILRDGDPGEPEILLSPLTYLWQHRAEIEVIVQMAPSAAATAALDVLLGEVGAVLATDRTLDGLVDWIEWGAPRTHDLAIDGAAGLKGAVVAVTLHYETSDPLA